jgi:pyruvate formate lyase activating enzyme
MAARPLIVDIKRHSLEDGPGIRSVVFFKGCPLRCVFCHSPETQLPGPELAFYPDRCAGARSCAAACPRGAIAVDRPDRVDRTACEPCEECSAACPSGGLRLIGRSLPVEELAARLLADRPFYTHSGGGVTLSGGECTMHPDYVEELLVRLAAEGVRVAIETAGHTDPDRLLRQILPHVALVFYDLKFADAGLHRRCTGQGNELILANLERVLAHPGVEVRVRVPLVPGLTTTEENLAGLVTVLCELRAPSVSLLPWNPMGLAMAERLGRPQPPLPAKFMSREEEDRIGDVMAALIADRRRAPIRLDRPTST